MINFSLYDITKKVSSYQAELLQNIAKAGNVLTIIRGTVEYEAATRLQEHKLLTLCDDDFVITKEGYEYLNYLANQDLYENECAI